jgi:hypothetical protein
MNMNFMPYPKMHAAMKANAQPVLLALCCLLLQSATFSSALAQNTNCCGAVGGVKYVQYPDLTNGVDFDANLSPNDPTGYTWVLADDFRCTNSGPITTIAVWGSWLSDDEDPDAFYSVGIWSDAPTNALNNFNHPDRSWFGLRR